MGIKETILVTTAVVYISLGAPLHVLPLALRPSTAWPIDHRTTLHPWSVQNGGVLPSGALYVYHIPGIPAKGAYDAALPSVSIPYNYVTRNPPSRLFYNSLGDIISAMPFLPIELNVPDMVNWMMNFMMNNMPFINRWQYQDESEPRIHYYLSRFFNGSKGNPAGNVLKDMPWMYP